MAIGRIADKREGVASERDVLAQIVRELRWTRDHIKDENPGAANMQLSSVEGLVRILQEQLSRGIHVNPSHTPNPALMIYGNPNDVCLARGGVQAIVYTHAKDGSERVHGFGDAPTTLRNVANALTIRGLKRTTGVSMYGTADKKTIIVRGDRGQKLWDYFPEGDA